MRILLRTELDCTPDDAWRIITGPPGMLAAAAPLLSFRSLEPGGFPDSWPEGPHVVEVVALGLAPVGSQAIDIRFERRGDARIVHDTGRGLSWPLTLTTRWRHRMAVSPLGDGSRTLFRDELRFSAGVVTPLLWVGYWAFWQWRERRIIRLARRARLRGR